MNLANFNSHRTHICFSRNYLPLFLLILMPAMLATLPAASYGSSKNNSYTQQANLRNQLAYLSVHIPANLKPIYRQHNFAVDRYSSIEVHLNKWDEPKYHGEYYELLDEDGNFFHPNEYGKRTNYKLSFNNTRGGFIGHIMAGDVLNIAVPPGEYTLSFYVSNRMGGKRSVKGERFVEGNRLRSGYYNIYPSMIY